MEDPIKSQQEADEAFNFLVQTTMDTMNIDKEQAEKRITALFESGVLLNANPESPETQQQIDKFMSTQVD